MTNLYEGSECCGAPLVQVGKHKTVDGKTVTIEVCSECGKEYQFFRRSHPYGPYIGPTIEQPRKP